MNASGACGILARLHARRPPPRYRQADRPPPERCLARDITQASVRDTQEESKLENAESLDELVIRSVLPRDEAPTVEGPFPPFTVPADGDHEPRVRGAGQRQSKHPREQAGSGVDPALDAKAPTGANRRRRGMQAPERFRELTPAIAQDPQIQRRTNRHDLESEDQARQSVSFVRIIRSRMFLVIRWIRGSLRRKSRRGGFWNPGGDDNTTFHQQVPALKTRLPLRAVYSVVA